MSSFAMKSESNPVRGDVVIAVFGRDYGKPRPALVVQSDAFNPTHASMILCPISSEITGLYFARVRVPPSAQNGLELESEIMVDKLATVASQRIRQQIGRLTRAQMETVDRTLRIWLDLSP